MAHEGKSDVVVSGLVRACEQPLSRPVPLDQTGALRAATTLAAHKGGNEDPDRCRAETSVSCSAVRSRRKNPRPGEGALSSERLLASDGEWRRIDEDSSCARKGGNI